MSEVVIEAFVDNSIAVSGTVEPIVGLTDGSSVITCNGIDEKRVFVIRGILLLPGIPGFGDFYTKYIGDNLLTLSQPLVAGEYLYIKTIPV